MFDCSSVAPATPIEIRAVAAVWQHHCVRVWAASNVCGCGLWMRAVEEGGGLGLRLRKAGGELQRSTLAHDVRFVPSRTIFPTKTAAEIRFGYLFGWPEQALSRPSTFGSASSKPGVRLYRPTVGFVATIWQKRAPAVGHTGCTRVSAFRLPNQPRLRVSSKQSG